MHGKESELHKGAKLHTAHDTCLQAEAKGFAPNFLRSMYAKIIKKTTS
jgi:hypothetical protein